MPTKMLDNGSFLVRSKFVALRDSGTRAQAELEGQREVIATRGSSIMRNPFHECAPAGCACPRGTPRKSSAQSRSNRPHHLFRLHPAYPNSHQRRVFGGSDSETTTRNPGTADNPPPCYLLGTGRGGARDPQGAAATMPNRKCPGYQGLAKLCS
jgi:hypothetical protein